MVKLNCAAIPTGLLESELFGHERGAFTGAIAQKVGRFELADGGTLFLDELGDIPLELQSKLLRVLQEQEFERFEGTRTIKVNVRLLAATNRNLIQIVAEKTFRSDLYYRLNVFPLTIPALRERREHPFVGSIFCPEVGAADEETMDSISTEGIATLTQCGWPGNVRELENVIERATILSQGGELGLGAGKGLGPNGAGRSAVSPWSAPSALTSCEPCRLIGSSAGLTARPPNSA